MTSGGEWQRRRILIWGKTRPELSQKYREIVCTGGVFADTKRLVRLYPIPLRFLDDQHYFKKYQWIEAEVAKSREDPRPESYKIRFDHIHVGETISSKRGNWDERAQWVLDSGNLFDSVEELQRRQEQDNTSLGIIVPAEINRIQAVKYTRAESDSFWQRYKDAIAQMELPLDERTGEPRKPLQPPDYRYKISFRCHDPSCSGHEFSVLDWELSALYSGQRIQGRSQDVASQKVVEKLEQVCSSANDIRFFVGNIASHPKTFTLVGLWYPKRPKPASTDGNHTSQMKLFGG